MKVILDPKAGICGGVRRTIQLVEKELSREDDQEVFVVGDIIHNEREIERLEQDGLKTLIPRFLDDLTNHDSIPNGKSTVLIRAHGEPPRTFKELDLLGVDVIDGTCPVVTRSQDLAREHLLKGYQVAVVGKHGHPEMIGILGHTDNKAVCIQSEEDIAKLQPDTLTLIMAQTTIGSGMFAQMVEKIKEHVGKIEIRNTICRFVLNRNIKLPNFTSEADVILVVGGKKSSNTNMLYRTCLAINPRSYHVVSPNEIEREWFIGSNSIGITGSASTPIWLLHEFEETLNRWIKAGWPENAVEFDV